MASASGSSSAAPTQPSYIIVGAGVFGVSTAYHLIRKYPGASVTLVDRDAFDADSRVAASWDWNKVVRADYDDPVYCRLALEAQDVFEGDPLWKPYFHQTGIYWICRSDYARAVVDNYRRLGRAADLRAVPVDEARRLYGGLFDDADYSGGVQEVLVNRTSGWAAAGDALRAVTREALRLGVRYRVGEVASLRFDPRSGRCAGVALKKGEGGGQQQEVLAADHTLLCAGAYTATLLEQSAARTGVPALRAGHRIVAGGITTGMTKLDDQSYSRFADMPVGIQGYTTAIGPFIGSLPPTPDRELKWWGQTIFKNTREVAPNRFCSAPPPEPDYAQWKVSQRLKDDITHASNVFYGKASDGWKFDKHRICWDAFSPSCDFIISPHPASQGLFVATCGSFHGYKFFPVLGKYITQMMEGELEPELAAKWSWDREFDDPWYASDFPRSEMKDLVGRSRL